MELMFNELSNRPLADNKYKANEAMVLFSQTVKEAGKYKFNHVRSPYSVNEIYLMDEYTIYDWMIDKTMSKTNRDYLFGKISPPFIDENDVLIEEEYLKAEYYFEGRNNGIEKVKCYGLAAAYLYDTLSISLPISNGWMRNNISIIIDSDNTTAIAIIKNVFSQACFSIPDLSVYLEQTGDVTLVETTIDPDHKNIHLAEHHGLKELRELWYKLKNSPYVIGGRSTGWGGNGFIRKIEKSGIIEIVLVDSERQYALQVQTTGRNYRETKLISEILEEKYS
ncbi:hypothetical protein FACS1894140_6560 [Spirochaetia bacterium]|nr:hypothetical protein FACS1894140_6560 [Spirochaetia bacterium]